MQKRKQTKNNSGRLRKNKTKNKKKQNKLYQKQKRPRTVRLHGPKALSVHGAPLRKESKQTGGETQTVEGSRQLGKSVVNETLNCVDAGFVKRPQSPATPPVPLRANKNTVRETLFAK